MTVNKTLICGLIFLSSINFIIVNANNVQPQNTGGQRSNDQHLRNTQDESKPAEGQPEPQQQPEIEWSDHEDYVPYQGESQDTFDWLYAQTMMLKDQSNMVVSPFSVKLLLVLLSEASGTDTTTQKELSIILSNIRAPYTARVLYGKIFNSLKAPSDYYDFRMGTKLFVDQYIEPTQRYSAILERYYDTMIERLDFKDLTRTTGYINQWCSNITNGHIKNLVNEADVDKSVMIMLNAIYFNGLWRQPFPTNQTTELPFYISSTQQLKTTYMVQTARYYFLDSAQLNAKIIRIPYKGKKFSMLVVLPNSKEGLGEFIRQMDGTTIHRAEWLMDEDEIRLVLPKFKFEYSSNLNSILKELGIREIFTPDASLPLLARGQGLQTQLQVSNVIQKAGIQIDEKGSTLFAATEVSLINKFGGTKEFIANRPFLFFIQDETTGTLLFAGKVTNPAEFEVPE